jgi:soluble lytic murein transglycosylase
MNARAVRRARARARSGRARSARRRALVLLAVAGLAVVAVAVIVPTLHRAVREVTLPLRHEDIIRQQARAKHLDPALVAAVIFAESKFRDATSPTGAKGLMQIQPDTARFIARRTGGTAFEIADLGSPQINIQYGCYYLRYLLDRYGDNAVLAVAAYNGGETNVDRWIADSGRRGKAFKVKDIRFPETRAYVERVIKAERDYRREYSSELGL